MGLLLYATPAGAIHSTRLPRPSWEELQELLNVGLGNLVECMAPAGVAYRSRPMSSSLHDSLQILEEGDQVEVLERKGEWIRDSVGWLPLRIDSSPIFSVRYL